jgi:pilus assembly protein Flp/PilA
MLSMFRKFRRNQSGATAIEYALIAAVLGIGILAGAQGLRDQISTKMTTAGSDLAKAN